MNATYKTPFLVVAGLALVVGLLGVLDLRNAPYSGYFGSPTNHVVRVFPNSPADIAGLEKGDRLLSIGGVAVEDTKNMVRRPRAAIGETRTFVVERAGEERAIDMTYVGLPGVTMGLALSGAIIGLCYLIAPIRAYVIKPSASSTVLALFGIAFGIAFLPGPYTESYLLRTIAGSLATSTIVLGFAFLVHFVMIFPSSGAFMEKSWAKQVIYGPAILLALFFMVLTVLQPEGTAGLNQAVGLLVGVFIGGFFSWALVAMVKTYRAADAAARSQHGLRLMLIGTLAGLIPLTISSLIGAIAPEIQANLPGVRFYFLTLGIIPIVFAIAVMRSPAESATG